MNQIVNNLRKHQSTTPSRWRERANWREENKSWLRHSQHIAMMMLDKMEELGMTQRVLAAPMGKVKQDSAPKNIVSHSVSIPNGKGKATNWQRKLF